MFTIHFNKVKKAYGCVREGGQSQRANEMGHDSGYMHTYICVCVSLFVCVPGEPGGNIIKI